MDPLAALVSALPHLPMHVVLHMRRVCKRWRDAVDRRYTRHHATFTVTCFPYATSAVRCVHASVTAHWLCGNERRAGCITALVPFNALLTRHLVATHDGVVPARVPLGQWHAVAYGTKVLGCVHVPHQAWPAAYDTRAVFAVDGVTCTYADLHRAFARVQLDDEGRHLLHVPVPHAGTRCCDIIIAWNAVCNKDMARANQPSHATCHLHVNLLGIVFTATATHATPATSSPASPPSPRP